MFGFFKKKAPETPSENPIIKMLSWETGVYVGAVKEIFDRLDDNTKCQVIIAYLNAHIFLTAAYGVAKQRNEPAATLEDFIVKNACGNGVKTLIGCSLKCSTILSTWMKRDSKNTIPQRSKN